MAMNGGEGPDSYVQNSTYQVIYFSIYFLSYLVCTTSPFNGVCSYKKNKIKNKKLVFVEATTTYMKMAGWFVLGYLIKILLFIENWGSNG